MTNEIQEKKFADWCSRKSSANFVGERNQKGKFHKEILMSYP